MQITINMAINWDLLEFHQFLALSSTITDSLEFSSYMLCEWSCDFFIYLFIYL